MRITEEGRIAVSAFQAGLALGAELAAEGEASNVRVFHSEGLTAVLLQAARGFFAARRGAPSAAPPPQPPNPAAAASSGSQGSPLDPMRATECPQCVYVGSDAKWYFDGRQVFHCSWSVGQVRFGFGPRPSMDRGVLPARAPDYGEFADLRRVRVPDSGTRPSAYDSYGEVADEFFRAFGEYPTHVQHGGARA